MPLTATTAAGLVVPLILAGEPRGALFEGSCERAGADTRLIDLPTLAPGLVAPVVVSTGDLLGPEPFSGFALEGPPDVQARLLRVLQRSTGEPLFDAVLPGHDELGESRSTLERLGRPGGVPWLVANVGLDAPHRPHRVFVRRGVTVGLTGVVDDQLAPSIDPDVRPSIRPPAPALDAAVDALRKAGVDVVAAMIHVRPSDGLRRVVAILESLERPPPDLVLVSPLAGDPAVIRFDALGTVVVTAPPTAEEAAVVQLRLDPVGDLDRVEVERRRPPVVPSASADAVRNWVCRALDEVLAPRRSTDIDRDRFVLLTLEAMRRAAQAEIAILPGASFGDRGAFPLSPDATRLDLRRALPLDDRLAVTEVEGSALGPIEALAARPDVESWGLEPGKVAGRAVDPLRTYRIVTTDFVAEGGDRLLDPTGYRFEPVTDRGSLREAVREALAAGRGMAGKGLDEPVLFDLRIQLGANLKSVSVDNRSAAEAPQLTREDFLGVTGDFRLRLVVDFPRHRIELAERTRYGIVRETPDPGQDALTVENEDVTIVELTYAGRLRGGVERPWIPDAGATARLETELTVPEERDYRRALFQFGVGPSWALTGNLSFRSQLGLRRELLASEASADEAEAALAETRVALLSAVELRDEVLTQIGPAPSVLNLRLDHSVDLSGRVRDQVLQGRLGIDVPIIDGVSLTASVDAYILERDQTGGRSSSGAALDTSFGISSSTDLSRVFF